MSEWPHWLRALLLFLAVPVGILALVRLAVWLEPRAPHRDPRWYDAWILGGLLTLALAALAWMVTA